MIVDNLVRFVIFVYVCVEYKCWSIQAQLLGQYSALWDNFLLRLATCW
jgi:hypothetical protein